MAIRTKLTTADEVQTRTTAAPAAAPKGAPGQRTEEDKARRKERVEKAKDALARSLELKGDHVVQARTALKGYLRSLNDSKQPNDEQFEALVEGPFRAPPKKKEQGFGGRGGFGGGGGGGGGFGGRPGGAAGGPGSTRSGGPPTGQSGR